MGDINKENKDAVGSDAVFKEPSSPKNLSKKEKTKYQTFRSDEDDSSDNEDTEQGARLRRKVKKDRSNTTSFKVKIKNIKKKEKKEKDKDEKKDKEKKDKNREKKRVKKTEDTAKEKETYPLHGPVFGVPLDVAVERSGFPDKIELPRIVRECILFIEEKGLDTEGIYRVSGVKSKVDHLKGLYNEGRTVSLDECDPNTVASLLKLYLRELPSSILTTRLAPIFDNCINLDNEEEQVNRFNQLLNDLPCPNRTLLQWMFTHFEHVMEKGAESKMNIQNLSIVFSPTMSISHGVLNIFFQHTKEFFPNVKLTKYIPPPENNDELPNTLQGLQELLEENEAVLADLHDKVNQGDGSQDEELWERQRQATQIKRKIRALKKLEKQNIDTQKEKEDEPHDKQPIVHVDATKSAPNQNTTHAWKAEIVVEKTQVGPGESQPAAEVKPPTLLKTAAKQKKKKAPNPPMPIATTSVENFAETSTTAAQPPATSTVSVPPVQLAEPAASVSQSATEPYYDEEYQKMLREERSLMIENEELLAVTQIIKRKIQIEQREIDSLKNKIQECIENKDNNHDLSSSVSSSFSSSSSISQEEDDLEFMSDEEDILQLEMILQDLEKDNERLEKEGKELVLKISDERKLCSKLRTEIRVKEEEMASSAPGIKR